MAYLSNNKAKTTWKILVDLDFIYYICHLDTWDGQKKYYFNLFSKAIYDHMQNLNLSIVS